MKLLDQEKILHRKVGRHRRVLMEDVMNYKAAIDAEREAVLDRLVVEAQEQDIGLRASMSRYTVLLDANVLYRAPAGSVLAACRDRPLPRQMDGGHPPGVD